MSLQLTDSKPSSTQTVQSQSQSQKTNPAYLKRREQVRRAQRTHRERKESYIKALEDQVLQLRADESRIVQENASLRGQVMRLEEMLCVRREETCVRDSPGDSSYRLFDDGAMCLPIEEVGDSELLAMGGGSAYSTSGGHGPSPWDAIASSPGTLSTAISKHGKSRTSVNAVDQTDLAIEFVLALEKPCQTRVQSAIFSPPYQSSYIKVTSEAGAVAYHSFLEDNFFDSAIEPKDSLDNLLSLSTAFCLSDEVTPIQAWQQIVTHPGFEYVEIDRLRALMEELLEHVICYGFGAVIEKRVFKMLVQNIFARVRL